MPTKNATVNGNVGKPVRVVEHCGKLYGLVHVKESSCATCAFIYGAKCVRPFAESCLDDFGRISHNYVWKLLPDSKQRNALEKKKSNGNGRRSALAALLDTAVRMLPIDSCRLCTYHGLQACHLTTRKSKRCPESGIPKWCPLPKPER